MAAQGRNADLGPGGRRGLGAAAVEGPRGHGGIQRARPRAAHGDAGGKRRAAEARAARSRPEDEDTSLARKPGGKEAGAAGWRRVPGHPQGGRRGGRGESEKTQPRMGGPLRGVGQEASRPKELTERPQIDSGELRADLPGGSKAF